MPNSSSSISAAQCVSGYILSDFWQFWAGATITQLTYNFVWDLSLSQLHILVRSSHLVSQRTFQVQVYIPFHIIGTAYSEGSCVNNWLSLLIAPFIPLVHIWCTLVSCTSLKRVCAKRERQKLCNTASELLYCVALQVLYVKLVVFSVTPAQTLLCLPQMNDHLYHILNHFSCPLSVS